MKNLEFRHSRQASEEDIEALERHFGSLPEKYIEILREHDGAYCNAGYAKEFTPRSMTFPPRIERFILSSEIIETASNIEGFPEQHLPFADDGGGGFSCYFSENKKIYYFDPDWAELHMIAEDFDMWSELLLPLET